MARRARLRLILALCLVGAFMIVPAVAGALPSVVVTGTITAADTGAKLEGIQVEAYARSSGGVSGGGDVTNANGEYSIGLDPSVEASVSVFSWDPTGIRDGYGSPETKVAPGGTLRYDFALKKDSRAPMVDLYNDTRAYLPRISVKQLSATALPAEVVEWAILSDGSDELQIAAEDDQYYSGRYWGFYNGSGIKHLSYSVDGAAWVDRTPLQATYTNWYDDRPLRVYDTLPQLPEGAHSVRFSATDVLGNVSKINSELVIVDQTPPSTTYDRATATTRKLDLVASDALSGVKITFLKTGATGTFGYGTTVDVPTSGYNYVDYYSQDRVGHTEDAKTLKVSAPAKLSTPKPSTSSISRTKTFKVTGSVYARRGAQGYLRIYKYDDGKYKYVGKRAFTENADGKYLVSLRLSKGTYRFRAAYGAYTDTWANPPVRSDRSAKVRVK